MFFLTLGIEKQELIKVNGGGMSVSLGLIIGAGVVFIIGLIDGFVRPLSCN